VQSKKSLAKMGFSFLAHRLLVTKAEIYFAQFRIGQNRNRKWRKNNAKSPEMFV
jgi:hypothetical protein